MEIKTAQEARIIKRKLLSKFDEKSKELTEIKKGLLKVDSILTSFKYLELPFVVEIQEAGNGVDGIGISVETHSFEDVDSALVFINGLVASHDRDLDIYLLKVSLDDNNLFKKSYELIRYDKISTENVSPNFIFYNLMKLSKNKFELDSQDFIPISLFSKEKDNDLWEISNLSEILNFLFVLTENYDRALAVGDIKAITQDSKLIKSKANVDKVFMFLNNESCHFNLIQNTSSRQFELNQLYNADNLDDVVAIHYFFNFN